MLLAGRYEIGDKIGSGGMGDVFRGLDSRTGESVAIKALKDSLLNKNHAVIARFQREAETLRQLAHPNIVKILDAFEHDGQHFIVMEYLSGGSLRDQLKAHGPLPVEKVLAISLELADALTRSHHLNVIHRDIKPENVLLADDGTPRLSDFGVAQMTQASRLTSGEAIVDTFHYLSPEALNGQPLDSRTDIWAFGVMLYELLTGIRPFRGERVDQLMKAILMDYPDPDLEVLRPDIPVALVDLIYRMLEKDPNARITSVRHIGAEVEDILHGRTEIISHSRFDTPAPKTVVYQRPKHNLPASTTPFIGREAELEQLTNMLRGPDVRLVSIVAQGGMGKSRLALEIAAYYAKRTQGNTVFTDGVYFVELAPLSDPSTIPTAIAQAISYQFAGDGREPKQQLLDFLRNKTMLLVMDNYEHLLDGAGLVTEILRAAPDVQILATSRERLSLPGETVFYLTGMDFPTRESSEDGLDYAAVQLFVSSARRVQPHFQLTESNVADVARICQLVEGLPLGLLLAASWLIMLSPREIADEIEQSIDILEAASSEVEERHHSVRVVFDQSWHRLSEKEQQVFMQLSVFRGNFTRQAVQMVTGADLRTLVSLANQSLLRRNPETGDYDLHPLLREFARDHLVVIPDLETATCHRHAAYYAELLSERYADLKGPEMRETITEITASLDNIHAAFQWANQHHEHQLVRQMGLPLFIYFRVSDRPAAEGIELFSEALAFWKEDGHSEVRRIYGQLLVFSEGLVEVPKQRTRILSEAIPILREHNDVEVLVQALLRAGYDLANFDRFEEAETVFNEALRLSEAVNDPFCLAGSHCSLGRLIVRSGDYSRAMQHLQVSLAEAQRSGSPFQIISSTYHLGRMASRMRDQVASEQYYLNALNMARKVNLLKQQIDCLSALGWYYRVQKRFDESWMVLEEALHLANEMGSSRSRAETLHSVGWLAWEQGRLSEAREHFKETLQLRRETNDRLMEAYSLDFLAMVAQDMGNTQESILLGDQAYNLALELGNMEVVTNITGNCGWRALLREDFYDARRFILEVCRLEGNNANNLINLGHACAGLGEHEESVTAYVQGLALARQMKDTESMLEAVAGLARHVARGGELGKGVTILSLVINHHHTPRNVRQHFAEPLLVEFEAEMSEDRFKATVELGKSLDLDAIVQELLAEFGPESG